MSRTIGRWILWIGILLTSPEYRKISTIAGDGERGPGEARGEARSARIDQPFGVETAPDGSLFICDAGNHRVLRLDPKGATVSPVAGSGKRGWSGDGGEALKADLDEPYEVRLHERGDLYFVEMRGAVVRKVEAHTGILRRVAGTGRAGFHGDGGSALEAELSSPHSICLDPRGGLFVADLGNHRIRRVDFASGRIETIAGTGATEMPADGAVATGKPLNGPRALCVASGTLWIALREGNAVWGMDLETRKLRRVAGTGATGFRDGPAAEATFNGPKGIAVGPGEDLFVADTENQAIRRIELKTGWVSTVAGVGPQSRGFGGDDGPPLKGKLDRPHGIAVGADGTIYVGDTNNHRVRKIR